ncbi:hypothetical protein Tco_0884524 [Tanacetum coccineum]
MEHGLESRLEEKKRAIYGMCSIIPKPRQRLFNDSRLRGKERMLAMLSSVATILMEMFPFGHCPEGNGDVSSVSSRALRMFIEKSYDEVYGCLKGDSENSEGKRLAISMVEETWLSEKEDV